MVNWQGQDKMSSQLFTALLSVLILVHRLFSGAGLGLLVVPGATLPWVTDLSVRVPPRALGQGGPYTLQVLYCDVLRCQAAEAGPRYKNACVVCSCERGHAPHWDFYALYNTVALYVSRKFTVPE